MPLKVRSSVGGSYDSNQIYYNISIVNNDEDLVSPSSGILIGSPEPVQCSFSENRNNPYLNNPDDYFMSVIRFRVDSSTLPVFAPNPKKLQDEPNKLIYTITLSYKDIFVYYDVRFNPKLAMYELPPPVNPTKNNPYYYLNTYESFITMINKCFVDVFAILNTYALFHTPQYILPTTIPPVLVWDNNTNKATLYCDISNNAYDTNDDDAIKIYFNSPLYELFSSFSAIRTVPTVFNNNPINFDFGDRTGNYKLLIYDTGFNRRPAATGNNPGLSYDTIYLEQTYSTSPLWTPITSIVFTTGFLPVVPELTGLPKNIGTAQQFASTGNNANISNTLTDFEVGLTTGLEYKPVFQYAPPGEYRLVDLFGSNPLSNLEIKVFWKDEDGNLYPVTLGTKESANIKILFRKKALYNTDLLYMN